MYCGTAFGALQFWRHEVQRAVPSILKNLFGFTCVLFMFCVTRQGLLSDSDVYQRLTVARVLFAARATL
jgi:hypothetical protein